MPEAALTLVTYFKAKSDQSKSLAQALKHLEQGMSKEEGCLTVNAFAKEDEEGRFMLFERWESQADLDKHHEGEPFKTFKAQWDTLLAKPLESSNYDPL